MDRPQEAHLLPLFVCFSLCKSSSWSRSKAGGRDSKTWYHVTQERRDPMKVIRTAGCDLGVDQSTPHVGLRVTWESAPL
ncbi:hypothetical protein Taro_040177 [Colocasia esculenta]|uniref:Uncharacterized protein n=1 Tax=Colocasia esculenta TaxID=4460 RepID=A0A843WL23_COLES|nr:hypothetical protein [Colocasia esculenta]